MNNTPKEKNVWIDFKAQKTLSFVFYIVFAVIVFSMFFFFDFNRDVEGEYNDSQISLNDYVESQNKAFYRDLDYSEHFLEDKIVSLLEGRYWFNFESVVEDYNIVVNDNVVFIPNFSNFDLNIEDSSLEISVYEGDLYLGFLEEGVALDKGAVLDENFDGFMNVLLLPRDTYMKLSYRKINRSLIGLMYNKLVKVMDVYSAIPSQNRETDWYKDNRAFDLEYLNVLKTELRARVLEDESNDSAFADFYLKLKDSFTFSPKKIVYKKLNFASKVSDYLLSKADLDIFSDLDADYDFSEDYYSYLEVFDVFEREYDLFEYFFLEDLSVSSRLDRIWKNFYLAKDIDPVLSKQLLKQYYEYYFQNTELLFAECSVDCLFNMNQLLDNLFMRYFLYYEMDFVEYKSRFENDLLALELSSSQMQEFKQALINQKINLLKRTWYLLNEDELDLDFVLVFYDYQLSEIADLMSSLSSDTAVISFFKQQLESVEDYWGYLKSPDYSENLIYGYKHEERYAAYLRDRAFTPNIEDVLSDDLKEEDTLDDLSDEILEFLDDLDFQSIVLEDFSDVNQRFVQLSAVLGGYSFSADFDRYTNLFKNVYAYEDLIAEESIKPSNLLALFEREYADLKDGDEDLDEEELDSYIESHAQRVAKNYILEKMKAYDFVMELDNISIVEGKDTLFRIEDVYLHGYADIVVTFDFILNTETCENIYMNYKSKPLILDGPYTLEELSALILAEQDFSVLEEEDDDVVVFDEEGLEEESDLSDDENLEVLDEEETI